MTERPFFNLIIVMNQKYVIIGGGLTGLTIAHMLRRHQKEVVLLEANEKLGGKYRGEATSLGFIAPSEEAAQTLEWLRNISPTPVSWREEDHQPLLFESHEWRPFLGFGDFPSNVVNELSYFNQAKQWILEPGIEQVTRAFIEQLPFEARTRAEVTGFEVSDGKIQNVIVNAQDKVAGDHFIFCPSPHYLNNLLPHDVLKPAHRTKLAKQPAWTAVALILNHKAPIETSNAIRFVLGSGKEFEPVIGRVWPSHSIWLNLVSSERDEDLEHVGDCVRFIKRTLKRVWPELLDGSTDEKIRVRPQAYGKLDLKLKNGVFPELPNLWMADGRMSDLGGELASVAVSRAFETAWFPVDQAPTDSYTNPIS
jgi:hypothetical protein